MKREHVFISSPPGEIDFRYDKFTDGLWFHSAKQWIANIMPGVLASAGRLNITISTVRTLPLLRDPDLLFLPEARGWVVRLIAPIGGTHGDLWGGLLFHNPASDPTPCIEKFSPEDNGVRKVLAAHYTAEKIDSFRNPTKPREETWIRPDIRLVDIIEDGGYPLPNWQKAVEGLSFEEAQIRMNALRCSGSSPAQYYEKRKREKEEAERQANIEEEAIFAKRREEWLAEVSQEAAGQAEAPEVSDAPVEPETPPVMTREAIQAARKKREKMAKATRSKVAADKANKANAETWAAKRISDLERAGKL
jgi:hypothetical protein